MNLKKSLLLSLTVFATLLAVQAREYSPKFICGVVKADSWTLNNNQEGIYEYDLAAGTLSKLTEGRDVYQAPLGGAVYEDGAMKGIHFKTVWDDFDQTNTYVLYHVEYDMQSWQRTKAVTLGDMDRNYISSCGMAHNPVNNKNYGIFYNFNMSWQVVSRKLAEIDFSTDVPKRTILGTASIPMAAIACRDNGLLYGVGMEGWLYAISTADAGGNEIEVIPLGDLGIGNISTNPASMTFDSRTGKFYLSVVLTDQKCYLYEINPEIGSVAATQLTQTPDNAWLVNLYIPEAQADDDAPAAVTNLAATFDDDPSFGTVTFTAPATTYAGDPLTGELTYTVTANGTEVAAGTVEAGSDASVEVNVGEIFGDVEIAVTVANEAGVSPKAAITVYIGPETPAAPYHVIFNYDYDTKQSTLSWTPTTIGVHDVDINPDNLTYNIYRMPENLLVGENITETNFTEDFDPETLAPYYYMVEPVHFGVKGESAQSNKAVVGPALEVPYTNNFSNKNSFNLLTILDNNFDGITWKWESSYSGGGRASYYGTPYQDADEWLLSPPIRLKRGATYAITFDANTAVSTTVDHLGVAYGKGLDTGNYTAVFDDITLNSPVTKTYKDENIVPGADGVYYFGFHCTSQTNRGWLLLHSFSVRMIADAPAVRGDVDGDGKVDVADINAIINVLLGTESNDKYEGRADIDGDSKVDIADANAVINIILNAE